MVKSSPLQPSAVGVILYVTVAFEVELLLLRKSVMLVPLPFVNPPAVDEPVAVQLNVVPAMGDVGI